MNIKRKLLRRIGSFLPVNTGFLLAKKSRHLRHLARPGFDFIYDQYLGSLSVLIDTTYPIESAMLTGRYDRDTTNLIEMLAKPTWTFVDVGANVGAISLVMAKAAPKGRVFAIEPGPFLCKRLRQNLALNKSLVHIVRVLELGVSDKPGELFWNEDSNNRGNAGLLENTGLAVPVTTLDKIIKDEGLTQLDFVKIDVEGMELEVIKGAQNAIASLRPIIYYETLEPFREARGFDLYTQIFNLLTPLGYRHFAVKKKGQIQPVSDLVRLQSSNVLAVPQERISDLSSFVKLHS